MADNRMYLQCKGCGKTIVLAKMYVNTGWYSASSPREKGQRLIDFIEKHQTCCNTIDDYDRHMEMDKDFEPFGLIYENNPNFAVGEDYMKMNRDKVIKELDSE